MWQEGESWKRYPSDLTDEPRVIIELLISPAK
jgi:hypothetical protein